MSQTRKDLTNRRFGRLIVIERGPNDNRNKSTWLCQCDCGDRPTIRANQLLRGKTKSCGCFRVDYHLTHGHDRKRKRTPEYAAWAAMKGRCYNKNDARYKHYGERGITVCSRWFNSFKNFIADMGLRPPQYTLERVNNDGNYESSNCKWATYSEQNRNKRRL